MKFTRVAAVVAAALALSACSSNRQQASGDFDYVDQPQRSRLTIPSNLEQPNGEGNYPVPEKSVNGSVGKQMNISSPRLIRPVALGSRVLENEQQTTVYFDVVDGMNRPVAEFVWQAAENVLQRRGLNWQNSAPNSWVSSEVEQSEQLESEEDASFWSLDESSSQSLRRQFRYQLTQQVAEHGRTTALTVDLVDVQQQLGQQPMAMPELAQNNREVTLVNDIISEVNRLQQQAIVSQGNQVVPLRLAENSKQQPAFIIGMAFENAWPLAGLALDEIGLVVDDLNRDAGTYFVEYNEPDSGFLFMGGDDYEPLAIEEGEYEVRLVEFDDETSMTILRDGEPLSAATLASFEAALSAALQEQNQR